MTMAVLVISTHERVWISLIKPTTRAKAAIEMRGCHDQASATNYRTPILTTVETSINQNLNYNYGEAHMENSCTYESLGRAACPSLI